MVGCTVISVVFGLATAVLFASSSLMASRAVKVIGSWSTVAWTMLVGLVITLPFLVASGIPAGLADNVGWMAIAGIGNVGGLVLAGLAYRVGKVGVITPILATEGAISAVIASLLGREHRPDRRLPAHGDRVRDRDRRSRA